MEESKRKAYEFVVHDFRTVTAGIDAIERELHRDQAPFAASGRCNFVLLFLCAEILRLFPDLAVLLKRLDARYEKVVDLISPWNSALVGRSLFEAWEEDKELAIGSSLSKNISARHLEIEDGRLVVMPTVMFEDMRSLITEFLENV